MLLLSIKSNKHLKEQKELEIIKVILITLIIMLNKIEVLYGNNIDDKVNYISSLN